MGGDYICSRWSSFGGHTNPTDSRWQGEQGPSQPHTSRCCIVGHGGLVGSTGIRHSVLGGRSRCTSMGPSSRIVTEYLSVARFPRARLCQTHKPLEQSGRTIVWLDGRSGRDVVVKIVGRCSHGYWRRWAAGPWR